ncbi:MAG: ribonuclease HIII [Candidatus Cloacimonetes bacterium]|nr:ribonuclease HIII [Candidatus Cloacimonadota bacterium]
MNYTEVSNSELLKATAKFLERIETEGYRLTDEKPINYGIRLMLEKENSSCGVTFYYSKKKGLSWIIDKKKGSTLHVKLAVFIATLFQPRLHNWKTWCGTDESGKGDVFGPLVTCGFVVEESIIPDLLTIGVKDSKRCTAEQIESIARELHRSYRERIEVVTLQPEKYNDLYNSFRNQGKKLNELLTWMHSRAIVSLRERMPFEGALVDQFAKNIRFNNAIKDTNKIQIKAATKAESDPAVAAASILARYHFLQGIKRISTKFGMKFPRGAGAGIAEAGDEFLQHWPRERMKEVAKLHFKNSFSGKKENQCL